MGGREEDEEIKKERKKEKSKLVLDCEAGINHVALRRRCYGSSLPLLYFNLLTI